jgi:hypothetical protein
MSNAFIYRMPAGIAGDVSRKELSKVEPQFVDSDYPVLRYGEPVKMVSAQLRPFTTGDDAVVPYGFGVRPYPIQGTTSEALGTATPPTTQPLDVLKSGYMTVNCKAGTPALNGSVYVRVVDSGVSTQPLGGIEAAADGGDCVAITGCIFMGAADSDGNVEIAYNI